jgi:hypothetical protein
VLTVLVCLQVTGVVDRLPDPDNGRVRVKTIEIGLERALREG